MEFGSIRIAGSVVIIAGCFMFMYPRLIHPVMVSIFGGNADTQKTGHKDNIQDIPPHKAPHHPGGPAHRVDSGEPMADNIRQHVRPGPHPGMRAAAQENARQAKGSPGRGMMGVILPMYAVGIVVYLVYTLCKVFNKKDPGERRDSDSPNREERPERTFEQHYGDDEGRVSSMQGATLTPAQVQEELQSLLSKAQDKHMTDTEMQQLQSRLAETETQMTKILQAMQSVQSRVVEQAGNQGAGNEEVGSQDTGNRDTGNQDTGNQDSEAPPGGEKTREPEPSEFTDDMERNKSLNASDLSSESNGDTESFEILNKSTSGSDVSAKVDTVTSRTAEEQNTDADEEEDDEEVEEAESEEASEEEESIEEMEDGESDGDAEDVVMDQEPTPTQDNVTVRKRTTTKDDSQS